MKVLMGSSPEHVDSALDRMQMGEASHEHVDIAKNALEGRHLKDPCSDAFVKCMTNGGSDEAMGACMTAWIACKGNDPQH